MLGCGNSTLSEDMYSAGYQHIANVDYSDIVIECMRQRTRHMDKMTWEVMDVREMHLNDGREVNEVDRVLAPGGKFIWITFGQPHFHMRHLQRDSWDIAVERLNDGDSSTSSM
ncbi:hypothetical protein IWW48_001937 [Coemansia sp. RSA 1200]|nr:hypothetical protein IWW48_001937 [Coemansia sp. RSA 1200]